VAGFIYALNRRNHRKMVRMQQEEALKQKEELDQMKFRFFTNISHELRTPLTLIITPLDMMIRRISDEAVKKQLGTIYKNAQNLLSLVNQLLDFRKLEMKGEKLHLMNGDMEEFISSAYNNFVPMAVEKHLNFVSQTVHRPLYMFFDSDKVHKIVNNLLSNAFKFTSEGGTVNLILSTEEIEQRNYVRIEVSDTGIGISESDLPYIFNRFYQVGNQGDEKMGSGIGLHLVREYVNIHEGRTTVSSRMDRGSTFVVWLPMDLKPESGDIFEEATDEKPDDKEKEASGVLLSADDSRRKVLLVEDNKEFRTFLKEQLEDFYQIVEAADGEEGERCAIDENPDLIISDIMMPKVDGIELCRRIKTNMQTSHIPVILLTARTADDIKINSYEVGADSYMSKPFNFDMLMVRIEKLIEQQEKRKQEFRKNIEVNPSAITITSLDEQLIQKCLEYIEKNMDHPEYGVEELSRDLGMVRMSLYRKLQSITGNTPTDFIRSIRLKRAAQLLQGSQLPIVEIANRVGFSSSSYFAKCFKEMFGVLPKQYAEDYGKKD
jgi:CheY-like chemotaxis protein/AraC-like DNA-binding protein